MHAIAVAAATAPTAATECFRWGRTSVAAARNGSIGGVGKHACHLILDAENNPSGTEINFQWRMIRKLTLGAESKAFYAESKKEWKPRLQLGLRSRN
jgi:hypothetical protein